MRPLHALLTSASLLLAAPMLTGCVVVMGGCEPSARYTSERDVSVPHIAGSGLDVETVNGEIAATGGPEAGSEVHIHATIRARSQERADAAEILTQRSADNALVVRVDWPDKRLRGEGCAFRISLPDTGWVRLDSDNGALTAAGLAGTADLRTSNGRITITDHGGPVTARSSNGRITAERIGGAVNADTSNGAITLSEVEGFAAADTSNGAISITLTPDSPGPIKATTSNGAVTILVGPAFAGELHANTSNGSISLPEGMKARGSKHSRVLKFADAGTPSTVTTSNGAITIKTLN